MPYKNYREFLKRGTRTFPKSKAFYCNDHRRMVDKHRFSHLKSEHQYVDKVGYVARDAPSGNAPSVWRRVRDADSDSNDVKY